RPAGRIPSGPSPRHAAEAQGGRPRRGAPRRSTSAMSAHPSRRGPRPRRGSYRELIHLLNRRYHLEWERAERLEVELARARRGGLWPAFALLRRLARGLRPPRDDLTSGVLPWPFQPLGEIDGRPHGRVSIVIPFKDRPELLRNCLSSLRLST